MNQLAHPTIILGGGFVGLFTALHLSKQNYSQPIILIEPRERFTFKPLLYELLTEEIKSEQVCPLYVDLLAGSKVSWIQDTVKSIALTQKQIYLDSGKVYNYDKLVLALGSRTTYFNIPGAEDNALPFTNDREALTLKLRLKDCLQTAVMTADPEKRQHLLTVAIIGAGPAGVELACTLADILPVWYDMIGGDYQEIRVVLVNRSDEILKGDINSSLRQTAQKSLGDRTINVELLLNAAVTKITPTGIEYSRNGEAHFLSAMTICWTGGTIPNPLLKQIPVASNQRGQLIAYSSLQLPNFPEVFVGGDCAYVADAPQPPTAQVAYQQGKAIADNLQALAQGRSTLPAKVNLRGTLMKLGIDEGIANLFDRVSIKGELGHLIRQATYLELLPKPIYNFKATTEWLTDELLQRNQPMSRHPDHQGKTPLVAGMSTVIASFLIAIPLIWRAVEPQTFQSQMKDTGIPTLLDKMTKSQDSVESK